MKIRLLEPSPLVMLDLAGLTFPRYRTLLAVADERVVALVAEQAGEAIALALAIADAKEASLLSLFVRPAHRNQGVGRNLLATLETELAQRGCQALSTTWTTGAPGNHALSAVLQRQAWSPPQARMVIYRAELARLGKAGWMQSFASLPAGHALVPWAELSPENIAQLRQAIRFEDWVPPDLVPFDYAGVGIDGAQPEPKLNLACLAWGEVVGWNFAHRINAASVRISCTFVRPDLQPHLFMLALWHTAFDRLAETAYQNLSWAVAVERTAMVSFNARFMAQYLSHQTESWESRKVLMRDSASRHDSGAEDAAE